MGRREQGYTPGTPCWVDLTTPDVEGAHRVLRRAARLDGARGDGRAPYWYFEHDGAVVGGLARAATRSSAPRGCRRRGRCTSASRTLQATVGARAGARRHVTLRAAWRSRARGDGAVADPQGGVTLLWQPGAVRGRRGRQRGRRLGVGRPPDAGPGGGRAVLRGPVRLDDQPRSRAPSGAYRSIAHEGRAHRRDHARAGAASTQPYWTVYIGVDDVDARWSAPRTPAAARSSSRWPCPSGRFAVGLDPQGAVFCVLESQRLRRLTARRRQLLVLALKLILAPAFVVGASLTARRFGPRIGGLVGGLPVVGGPILLVLAIVHDARLRPARGDRGVVGVDLAGGASWWPMRSACATRLAAWRLLAAWARVRRRHRRSSRCSPPPSTSRRPSACSPPARPSSSPPRCAGRAASAPSTPRAPSPAAAARLGPPGPRALRRRDGPGDHGASSSGRRPARRRACSRPRRSSPPSWPPSPHAQARSPDATLRAACAACSPASSSFAAVLLDDRRRCCRSARSASRSLSAAAVAALTRSRSPGANPSGPAPTLR